MHHTFFKLFFAGYSYDVYKIHRAPLKKRFLEFNDLSLFSNLIHSLYQYFTQRAKHAAVITYFEFCVSIKVTFSYLIHFFLYYTYSVCIKMVCFIFNFFYDCNTVGIYFFGTSGKCLTGDKSKGVF